MIEKLSRKIPAPLTREDWFIQYRGIGIMRHKMVTAMMDADRTDAEIMFARTDQNNDDVIRRHLLTVI